jgi:hypothetical protein
VTDGVVEGGEGFGGKNERGLGRELRRFGRNRGGEGGQQRVLFKLGEKAIVVGVLGIFMQPMMELRGGSECERSQPKGKSEPGDGKSASAAGPFMCKPEVHGSFTKPYFWRNARGIYGED